MGEVQKIEGGARNWVATVGSLIFAQKIAKLLTKIRVMRDIVCLCQKVMNDSPF